MNLPQFTAGLAVYRAKRAYRMDGPQGKIEEVEGAVFPAFGPWQIGGGGLPQPCNCSANCAKDCAGLMPQQYPFCYSQCYDLCASSCMPPPPAGPPCNPQELAKCLSTANLPIDSVNCNVTYGPPIQGMTCCRGQENVNLKTDALHCGSCNSSCSSGASCCNGACCGGAAGGGCCYSNSSGPTCVGFVPGTCPPTPQDPFPMCINPPPQLAGEQNNPNNCGTCGNVCSGVDPGCCAGACMDFNDNIDNCGSCGNVCGTGQTCQAGECVCAPLAPPAGGLVGNSNYYFDSGCGPIQGLQLTMNVKTEINSTTGFTVQLNAFSPKSAATTFQQYYFYIQNSQILAQINNWTSGSTYLVCGAQFLCNTPITNGIPEGYKLTLVLTYDGSENVTGATFGVYDNNGKQLANYPFPVSSVGCNCTPSPGVTCVGFSPGNVSPITAFTVDMVGPDNGSTADFTSGSGHLTYSVAGGQTLTALKTFPSQCAASGGTVEKSNMTYGTMNACPAQSLTQSFAF